MVEEVKHPIQPIVDVDGIHRFKENKIVSALLDTGILDMNAIGRLEFSREDREQFAQLIGYSISGASELNYMSNRVLLVADSESNFIINGGEETKEQELVKVLQEEIKYLQNIISGVRSAIDCVCEE